MTKADQKRIIEELTATVGGEMLARLPQFPEEWDGMEIRELFSELATRHAARDRMSPERLKAFHRTRIDEDL